MWFACLTLKLGADGTDFAAVDLATIHRKLYLHEVFDNSVLIERLVITIKPLVVFLNELNEIVP